MEDIDENLNEDSLSDSEFVERVGYAEDAAISADKVLVFLALNFWIIGWSNIT